MEGLWDRNLLSVEQPGDKVEDKSPCLLTHGQALERYLLAAAPLGVEVKCQPGLDSFVAAERHDPAPFPHEDPVTGVAWSDETLLNLEQTESAPSAPGYVGTYQMGCVLALNVLGNLSDLERFEALADYISVLDALRPARKPA